MKTLLLVGFALVASAFAVDPLSQEFVDSINNMKTTWTARRNFPEGTTIADLKRLAGALPNPEGFKLPIKQHRVPEGFAVPESFDSRVEWADCPTINEIRDQGSCGSCWAVAAVGAMSDRACIHSEGKENFRYSSENLVACCWTCGFGCDGGWLGPAWTWWQDTGLCSGGPYGSNEGCQPYTIKPTGFLEMINEPTPECKNECIPEYDTAYEDDLRYAMDAYKIAQNEEEIQMEIMTNGPVEVSFDVYEDFYSYSGGVYQHTSGSLLGGHAVKMLGWGEEDGVKYWIIANSWNVNWGEDGFFRIIRGQNECGIEGNVHAGTPKAL